MVGTHGPGLHVYYDLAGSSHRPHEGRMNCIPTFQKKKSSPGKEKSLKTTQMLPIGGWEWHRAPSSRDRMPRNIFSAVSRISARTDTQTHVRHTRHAFAPIPDTQDLSAHPGCQAHFAFHPAVMPPTLNGVKNRSFDLSSALPFTKHFHIH